MSSSTITPRREAKAYYTELGEDAFKRITIEDITRWTEANTKERIKTPKCHCTDLQMLRHRKVVATATDFQFVRESPVWKEYLKSPVGQELENQRWKQYRNADDKDLHTKETKKLLAPQGRFTTTTLILVMLAVLLVALGTMWMQGRPSKKGLETMGTRELSLDDEIRENPDLIPRVLRGNKDWTCEYWFDWPCEDWLDSDFVDSGNENWTDPDVTNEQWLVCHQDRWFKPKMTYKELIARLAQHEIPDAVILRQIFRPDGERELVVFQGSVVMA